MMFKYLKKYSCQNKKSLTKQKNAKIVKVMRDDGSLKSTDLFEAKGSLKSTDLFEAKGSLKTPKNIVDADYLQLVLFVLISGRFNYRIKYNYVFCVKNRLGKVIYNHINNSDPKMVIFNSKNIINSIEDNLIHSLNVSAQGFNEAHQKIQNFMYNIFYYFLKDRASMLTYEEKNIYLLEAFEFSSSTFYKVSILALFMKYVKNLDINLVLSCIKKIDTTLHFLEIHNLTGFNYFETVGEFATIEQFGREQNVTIRHIKKYYTNPQITLLNNYLFRYITNNKLDLTKTLKLFFNHVPNNTLCGINKEYHNILLEYMVENIAVLNVNQEICNLFAKINFSITNERLIFLCNHLNDKNILQLCENILKPLGPNKSSDSTEYEFDKIYSLMRYKKYKIQLIEICLDKGIIIKEE